jgi:hypothetical protein
MQQLDPQIEAAILSAQQAQSNVPLSQDPTAEARGYAKSGKRSDVRSAFGMHLGGQAPMHPSVNRHVNYSKTIGDLVKAARGNNGEDGQYTDYQTDRPMGGEGRDVANAALAGQAQGVPGQETSQQQPSVNPTIGPPAPTGSSPAFIAAQSQLRNQVNGPVSSQATASQIAANQGSAHASANRYGPPEEGPTDYSGMLPGILSSLSQTDPGKAADLIMQQQKMKADQEQRDTENQQKQFEQNSKAYEIGGKGTASEDAADAEYAQEAAQAKADADMPASTNNTNKSAQPEEGWLSKVLHEIF